jgi:heptosyltransferase III
MLNKVNRILLVRTDKIGDVVLTTPAIAALRKKFPDAHIAALVSQTAFDAVKHNPHMNEVWSLDPALYSGVIGFFRLISEIREGRYQAAVVFQTKFRVALALWLSRVRYRVGPLSKWWSFILYNLGRRQNRSAVEMHEADYNIQLLKEFGISVADTREKTYLVVGEKEKAEAEKFFTEKSINRKYKTVAIHPGMGGSALNWPESHYIALGRNLIKRYNVVITGGPTEAALVERVMTAVAQDQSYLMDRPILTKYVNEGSLANFIAILDQCDGMVGPSTGPMHLAVGLGKKVVTIFSPIRVQSAVRWGPYGVELGSNLGIAPKDQASVLVPDVNCAENQRCALAACIYYPCMPRVPVEDVETQLLVLLEGGDISMFKGSTFAGYDIGDAYGDEVDL